MPRLGDTIDPRLFLQDFSGFADASRIQGNGIINATDKIAGAINDFAKERKGLEKQYKEGAAKIDAAIKLFPDQAPKLEAIKNQLNDPNKTLRDHAATAASISDLIDMSVGQSRYDADQKFREHAMSLQDRQADIGERQANLGMMAQSQDMRAQDFKMGEAIKQASLDDSTKELIGPALLDNAINLLQKSNPKLADSLRESTKDRGPMDKYAAATAGMQFLTPVERAKAPTVTEISVPGGKQSIQFDDKSGQWIPIQTNIPEVILPPGVPDASSGEPLYTDAGLSDQQLGGVLPPLNGAGAIQRPGFTPTPTDPKLAMDAQKAKTEAEQAAATKAASIAKSQTLIDDLDKLEKHPGFQNLFGTNFGFSQTWIPGTEGADAKILLDKVKGQGFLEAVQALKGMGALSNAEGEKLSAAFLGLDKGMSEKAAKSQIEDLKSKVKQTIERASGVGPPVSGLVPNNDPAISASEGIRRSYAK